jgi:hypothetical protein
LTCVVPEKELDRAKPEQKISFIRRIESFFVHATAMTHMPKA